VAKTWGEAKLFIARANGGEGSPDNVAIAGDCLSAVIARFNSYHEWSWLTTEEEISVVAGTSDYATTPNIRSPYSVKLLTSGVTLPFKTQREIDRDYQWTDGAGPFCYTLYRAATFDPQLSMTTRVRFYPTPTVTETALHKYVRMMVQETTNDNLYVDARDDVLYDMLMYARGEYLLLKDAEAVRGQVLINRGEARLKQLRSWDLRGSNDRDIRLVPFDVWSRQGSATDGSSSSSSGSNDLILGESLVPDSGQ